MTRSTSSEEEPIVVETSTITIALSSEVNDDDPVSVVVTTWNDEFITNSDNATSNLLSDIQGVTVKTDNGDKLEETEDIDNGITIAMTLSIPSSNTSDHTDTSTVNLRKAIVCKYFDTVQDAWQDRGIVLRGMTFSTDAIAAICISSHLTLFTLKDESPAAKAVENSIQSLQKRFEIIADTDLFDDETTINFPVLAIFGVCTVITVVVTSCSKRHIAQNDLRTARKVYIQEGILKKPNVIGSLE